MRKSSKTNWGRKNEFRGAKFSNHFVVQICNVSSRVFVSGQQQYRHHNDYGHLITPGENAILYRGYRDQWYDHTKYRFDKYKCNEDDGYVVEPEKRNLDLKYIPNDAIPVDVATAPHGWII